MINIRQSSRRLACLFFLVLSFLCQYAQSQSTNEFTLGLIMAPSFSKLAEPSFTNSYKFRTNYGITANYDINKIRFSTGFVVLNQGYKNDFVEITILNPKAIGVFFPNYVNYKSLVIPLCIDFFLIKKSKISVFLHSGIYNGILLSYETKNDNIAFPKKGNLNEYNAGILLGGGVDFQIYNKLSLQIQPTWYYQINNAFKDFPEDFALTSLSVNISLMRKI